MWCCVCTRWAMPGYTQNGKDTQIDTYKSHSRHWTFSATLLHCLVHLLGPVSLYLTLSNIFFCLYVFLSIYLFGVCLCVCCVSLSLMCALSIAHFRFFAHKNGWHKRQASIQLYLIHLVSSFSIIWCEKGVQCTCRRILLSWVFRVYRLMNNRNESRTTNHQPTSELKWRDRERVRDEQANETRAPYTHSHNQYIYTETAHRIQA